ncbi:hypothetical protein ABZU76_06445 [Amycolatopsis sp. NPDC005232]|uniref:hypothetical protein n=1 Tax=Amycolatopsis sp. NPDC005232 TaxID=3157027 RepID=UPI0033A94965
MTARLTFHPDAAAHPAKNALAAPGSHVQPQDRTEESQMVATHEAPRTAGEQPAEVTTYSYTPDELNRLVSREIAGRLGEIAAQLCLMARYLIVNDGAPVAVKGPRVKTYLDVSTQLRLLAQQELETAGIAEEAAR